MSMRQILGFLKRAGGREDLRRYGYVWGFRTIGLGECIEVEEKGVCSKRMPSDVSALGRNQQVEFVVDSGVLDLELRWESVRGSKELSMVSLTDCLWACVRACVVWA